MRLLSSPALVSICLIAVAAVAVHGQVQDGQQASSLGDIARQNRQSKPTSATVRPEIKELIENLNAAAEDHGGEDQYKRDMLDLLTQRKFDALDNAAREARSSKSRFRGGTWRLYTFYKAISDPSAGGSASDAQWSAHVDLLNQWVATRPQSITARVALAETYYNWGWQARGKGYASTVTQQGWDRLGDRVQRAHRILTESSGLAERCPYWFEVMQHVALAEGWEKSRARALLDQAVSFEPGFFHFYREYTNFIAPRWYGTEGEAEAFVNEASTRAGGAEGAFLYFELSTVVLCVCDSDRARMTHLSWDKIKQGYNALEQLYGTSSLKMNRFAYMAYLAGDRPTAAQVFERLGTSWDQTVWRNRELYERARAWAASTPPTAEVQVAAPK
jgi:hypothetical protein